MVIAVVLALGAALAAGCGPVPARDVGKALFNDARTAGSDVNKFSCATCHAMGDAGAAIKPGYDLEDAAQRTRYWGGYAPSLLDATNHCLTFFMRGAPLAQDDPKARALYEYLASTATRPVTAELLPLTIVEDVATAPPKGDPARGAKVWDDACAVCHGAPHTGAGRIAEQASIVPESSQELAKQIDFSAAVIVAEKVRHGGFFGVGGTMPPFTKEQLGDDDLGALIAFLGL